MPHRRQVPRLGDCLVMFGADPDKVASALHQYYAHDDKRAGEHCLSVGACTSAQLAAALAYQEACRGNRIQAEYWLRRQDESSDGSRDRIERASAFLRCSRMALAKARN